MGLLTTACAGSSDEGRASSGASPSQSLPEFTSGLECPPAPEELSLDEAAGCVTVAEGDVEGDGDPERLLVYALLDPDRFPDAWRIRIERSDDPLDQRLDAGTPTSYPRAVGGADVDGDGHDEWFVKVLNLAGHGASWGVVNVFRLNERFEVVTFEGQPMLLYVGGISRTGEGIACREDALVQLRAEARNVRNTNWDVSARYFDISDGSAELLRREEDVLRLSDYNDPDLNRYYELNCGDLNYEV